MFFMQNGFKYNHRADDHSFYEKKANNYEASSWTRFARAHGLKADSIPEQYTRSGSYRKVYFENNEPVRPALYRCAYCGKMTTYKDTTIDHIFPINKLSYSKSVRNKAKRFGIKDANDKKNLVSACRVCNQKKGTKMGFWIYRGFLGKSEALWKIRKAIKWIFWFLLASLLFIFLFL